jgi:hypothetical protein
MTGLLKRSKLFDDRHTSWFDRWRICRLVERSDAHLAAKYSVSHRAWFGGRMVDGVFVRLLDEGFGSELEAVKEAFFVVELDGNQQRSVDVSK